MLHLTLKWNFMIYRHTHGFCPSDKHMKLTRVGSLVLFKSLLAHDVSVLTQFEGSVEIIFVKLSFHIFHVLWKKGVLRNWNLCQKRTPLPEIASFVYRHCSLIRPAVRALFQEEGWHWWLMILLQSRSSTFPKGWMRYEEHLRCGWEFEPVQNGKCQNCCCCHCSCRYSHPCS